MQRLVAGVAPSRIPPRVNAPARRVALRRPEDRLVSYAAVSDAVSDPSGLFGSSDFSEEEFLREFDSALSGANLKFKEGQRVEGLVFDVDGSGAYVDFGSKEMGFCSAECLGIKKVPKPPEVIKPNTRHQFEIRMTGVKSKKLGGDITLLHRGSLLKSIAYKRLHQMSDNQIKFKVKVKSKNGGGYVVEDDMGMEAFLPGRQAVINPAYTSRQNDEIVGTQIEVKVLDLLEEKGRFVVTQRGVVDPGIDTTKFAVGNLVEGVVERLMPFGVFVNLGGISGLLHESRITRGHMQDIGSVFRVQDKIKVLIMAKDRARARLSLSTRELEETPGDMLTDPQKVYDNAEEQAAKFRKKVETAEKRQKVAGGDIIQPDAVLDTSRLQSRETA